MLYQIIKIVLILEGDLTKSITILFLIFNFKLIDKNETKRFTILFFNQN